MSGLGAYGNGRQSSMTGKYGTRARISPEGRSIKNSWRFPKGGFPTAYWLVLMIVTISDNRGMR